MFTKMLQRRGLLADLPILDNGEFGMSTDTGQVFIGNGNTPEYNSNNGTNIEILTTLSIADHGALVGLADDDHTQYHTDARGDARYYQQAQFINISTGIADAALPILTNALGVIDDTFLPAHHVKYTDEEAQDAVGGILIDSASVDFTYDDAGNTITASVIAAGVDHGGLAGLADDDHAIYHTDVRGDIRYYTKTLLDAGQLDNRYYTEAEHINISTGAADAAKPILTDAAGVIDPSFLPAHHVKYTDEEAQDSVGGILTDTASVDFTYDDGLNIITATVLAGGVDHGSLAGLADDDHLQYHNDTRGDIRYYQKIEHIAASAGLVDAAKPVITSAAGYLDATFLMTEDAILTSRTVPVGYTYTHLNSDIQAGITLTVDGSFVAMNPQISAGGSMVVSGSVTVIPNVPVNIPPAGGFNIVTVLDMDYTSSILDHVIYSGLNAARTVTIPTGTAGDRLKIMDGTGNASALTPILVDNLGGSATFDGILGPLTLTTPYEHVELVNLTGNAWSVVK